MCWNVIYASGTVVWILWCQRMQLSPSFLSLDVYVAMLNLPLACSQWFSSDKVNCVALHADWITRIHAELRGYTQNYADTRVCAKWMSSNSVFLVARKIKGSLGLPRGMSFLFYKIRELWFYYLHPIARDVPLHNIENCQWEVARTEDAIDLPKLPLKKKYRARQRQDE